MPSLRVHPVEDEESSSSQVPYTRASLGFISIESSFRKRVIRLVSPQSYFDSFILTMIILNSISMACVDYRSVDENYEPVSTNSWRNRLIEIAEIFFMVIFVAECAFKIIAFGLIRGRHAYLRDSWNIFDFIIVILSIVSVIPIFPNLSALRSFRVLRPLRSVSKLPGLRKIIGALLESSEDLSNIMFLLAFLVICFSITGMTFWKGLLHSRCRLTPFPVIVSAACNNTSDWCWEDYIKNVTIDPASYKCLPDNNDDPTWTQSTSPWFIKGPQDCIWPIDNDDERVCSLSSKGGHRCTPLYQSNSESANRTCGSNFDAFGNPRFVDTIQPYGYPRMKSGNFVEGLNWGFTNYDSFPSAFVTSFQVITLEGWTDIMYQIIDAWALVPAVALFCIQVILCGYIVLNLVLAVIVKSLDELDDDDAESENTNLTKILEENGPVDIDDGLTASPLVGDEGTHEKKLKTRSLKEIVESGAHSVIIMVCIILNTLILSLDHYGIKAETSELLESFNTVFTVIFMIDVIICNVAFGIKKYWRDPFMCFDGIVGIISSTELIIIFATPAASSGSSAFSVLRSLRLFRIFKMAKNWQSLQSLLRTIASSLYEIGNFAALLILFMFIYSLVGMQLLANRLRFSIENGSDIGISDEAFTEGFIPRSHFDNFFWSMVTVFQLLTGENWNSIMYDCWRARGWIGVLFIVSLIVIGVFIVMNLFLAILLKNFEDSGALVDQKKLEQVLETREQINFDKDAQERRPSTIQILWAKIGPFRKLCLQVVENSKFDVAMTVIIVASSISLAIDNPLLDPQTNLVKILQVCDVLFTSMFVGELIIKVLAQGLFLEKGAYLRDGWNLLDFVVVLVSILSLASVGPGNSLKPLRTLRVLRPLRMVKRLPELKVVVDALLLSFPSVADVAVLCALFFLIFASFGVNFLKGTFYHCSGAAFERLTSQQVNYLTNPFEWNLLTSDEEAWFDVDVEGCNAAAWVGPTIPTSREVCDCLAPGSWMLTIPQTFDNVLFGISTLFEISTTEGWTEVMYAAIDQRGIGMQPIKNSNPIWALFFVCFLIFGAFFVMELFVGVTIDNFNKIRASTGKSLMTEGQKNWAKTQQFVMKIRPTRRVQRPEGTLRAKCYDIVMPDRNPYFEHFTTLCIVLSSAVAAFTSFGDSNDKSRFLGCLNLIFAFIFTVEVSIKGLVLEKNYFDDKWNTFDLFIVCGTNTGLLVGIFVSSASSIISIIRLGRICRLFRLVKSVKKLRALFNTMLIAIPSIINIGALLLLLFFVYAVVGVQLFSFVSQNDDVNEQANFQTFGKAMLLLLRFSTGENWNGFMRSIVDDNQDCEPNPVYNPDSPWCLVDGDFPNCTPLNGCGAGILAYAYFYSFTLLVSFVILNLFVGIVLEAFETSDEGDILSPKDLDDFTSKWSQFDPSATWYIKAQDMKKLLMSLDPPLGLGVRDVKRADEILDDPCLKDIPVNRNGNVNIVHAATSLAKRLVVQKLGEEFHELSENHPSQRKLRAARPSDEASKTLNEIYVERSKKKIRILRAMVKLGKATAIMTAAKLD